MISKVSRRCFFVGLSVFCLVSLSQSSVLANPFLNINRAINGINSTIGGFNQTVDNTNRTIRNVTETLGIQSNGSRNSVSGADTTEQVLGIYETWYRGLSASEKEIVSWLVMEYARSNEVTFATISSSEWFLQKPLQEQQKVGTLFFKLEQVVGAVEQNRSRFLAFAFCVNGGTQTCSAK